jgi:hypothetical protein
LVISAGGTMNREAVALGTPVMTTFQGRLGGVDEALIADGRLRAMADARDLDGLLAALPVSGGLPVQRPPRIRRDPRVLVDLLTKPVKP